MKKFSQSTVTAIISYKMHLGRYATHLKREYEDEIFYSLPSQYFYSGVSYDPTNLFVFVPADREIAWTTKRILEAENFRIRHNIFYNIQAGK